MDPGTPDIPPLPVEPPGAAPVPAGEVPPPPRRRRRIVPVALSLVVLIVIATIGVAALTGDHSRALALSFSKGATSKYHFQLTMRGMITISAQDVPVDFTMATDATLTVESVDATGTATVQETLSNTSVTGSGQAPSAPQIAPITLTMTPDGRVLSGTGLTLFSGGAAGPTQLGGNNLSAILPDGPVKVGDSWNKDISETVFGSELAYSAKSSYLRDERVGEVDTSVVRTHMTMPASFKVLLSDLAAFGTPPENLPADAAIAYDGDLSADTTTWIDRSQKEILKTTSAGAFDMMVTFQGIPQSLMPQGSSFELKGTMNITFARTG